MEPDPNAFSTGSKRAGLNRIRFLLESLVDLDLSLRKLGSRLLVLKGEPGEVLVRCLNEVIFLLLPCWPIFFRILSRNLDKTWNLSRNQLLEAGLNLVN